MKQTKSRFLKTKKREKYAVWIDNDDLDRLREYQQTIGVPVSESVRRAIKKYLEVLANRKRA
jgi:Ribbon-helix-helix domain